MLLFGVRVRAGVRTFAAPVLLVVLLAILVVLTIGPADTQAADSFSLTATMTAASNAYPPEQLLAASRIMVDGIGHVTSDVALTFDYIRYGEADTTHSNPLHTTGDGSLMMTGTYDPQTYRLEGRFHLEYATETTGGWFGPERREDTYEGHFFAVVTGPNNQVPVTVETVWNNQSYTMVGGEWKPLGGAHGNFTNTYIYRQIGGPVPPAPMATVKYAGNSSWISWDGATSWLPLKEGDVLRAGCIIRVGEEGNPMAGGGRVVITFAKGFTYVVDPNSRVQIFDWGAQVEGGSVDVEEEDANHPSRTTAATGMSSGKDPGAFQPDSAPDSGVPLSLNSAAAPGRNRYRVEVSSEGMKVSVFEGGAEVESAVTHAKVQLVSGQYVQVTAAGLGAVSSKAFADVSSSDPYRTAVLGMALKGIVDGYQAGDVWQFRPLESVKRAQFAKMIDGVMKLSVTEGMAIPFSDLGTDDPTDLYPHEYVAAAAAAGITAGVRPGQFAPYDPIKRAQVVTMIVRAANQLWPGMLESPPAGWAGALASFTDATHGPNMRMAEYNGLLEGLTGFGSAWNPWAQASRGEVAQMLWNLMTR